MLLRMPNRTHGFTLIELAMVALLLGLIAAIALPTGPNADVAMIDSAAYEVAAAVRYARDESIRTGVSHGVRQQSGANRFRVFRIDGTGTVIFDVYHPVSKQLWDIGFNTSPYFRNVVIERTNDWRATCNINGNIAFRSEGTPICTDPDTTLLEKGLLTLKMGSMRREINVDGFTGRVWLS